MHRPILLCAAALALATTASAQRDSTRVFSMGQPRALHPYAALSGVLDGGQGGGNLTLGVFKPLLNPIIGVGVAAEGSLGYADGIEASVRALASLRSLAFQVGGEYSLTDTRADLVLSFLPQIRRGGPFHQGGSLRVDWLPTRGASFRVGLTMPLGSRWAGEGRPYRESVALPRAPRRATPAPTFASDVTGTLRIAVRNAFWMSAFTNAFEDNSGGDETRALAAFRGNIRAWRDSLGDDASGFPTFPNADAEYHRAMAQAFDQATGRADLAAGLAAAARQALLEDVLMPYDRLLGRPKQYDSLRGFMPAAHARFGAVAAASGLDTAAQGRAHDVLQGFLDIAEANRAWILDHWEGDERLVWLPLQLALLPEEHDEQAELDDLVASAAGRPFSSGNWVLPVNNVRFYRDLVTSLHTARDYHVLWVHDFAGHDAIGQPDSVAYTVATEGYIDALAEAVARYDSTGAIPTFMINLDEKSYAGTGARVWMDLLEDPMGHRVRLPARHAAMSAGIEAAQERLRAAVAGSARLQADAARHGPRWLDNQVQVHVNITFPSDFSFRSSELVAWFPTWLQLLPDELMRDHRKVAFYDLTERDPRRGMALLAGTGVGEQYASPTWEDRGVATGGPAALGLKDAARALLLAQGVHPDEIPLPLRALSFPADYAEQVAALDAEGADALAVNVHNGVGFSPKQASAAQAVLYTLMPAGCVIYVPDSLWLSAFWAGQLTGAAFRGCAVRVIAPALANAPSASDPVMARSRSIVSRLLAMQTELQDVFNASGGDMRVGIYTRESAINDLPALLRESTEGYAATPWLRDEVPLPPDVLRLLADLPDDLDAGGFEVENIVDDVVDRSPNLHRKTQLFAMRPVLTQIARDLDAVTVRDALVAEAIGVARPDSVSLADRVGAAYPMISRVGLLPEALQRQAVFFAAVGSMNKDDRSLMLDGETLSVVAGKWSMAQFPDFVLLLGRTTWVTEQAEIDRLIPPYGAFPTRLGRLLRAVL